MADRAVLGAVVYGRVQGVYFRAFVQEQAARLGLTGYVRNQPGGRSVEVEAEGDRQQLAELLKCLHVGPPGARVDRVDVTWSGYSGKYSGFEVRY